METLVWFESTLARIWNWFRMTVVLLACLALSQRTPAANGQDLQCLRALAERGASAAVFAIVDREIPEMLEKQASFHLSVNRERLLWQTYVPHISVATVLLFAQTMLILELLRRRKRERIIRAHLRESEARLREAQSIAQCGSWMWDLSTNKTYWSDEMYRILGLIPQSIPPSNRLIHAGDHQYYL